MIKMMQALEAEDTHRIQFYTKTMILDWVSLFLNPILSSTMQCVIRNLHQDLQTIVTTFLRVHSIQVRREANVDTTSNHNATVPKGKERIEKEPGYRFWNIRLVSWGYVMND